ncbi:MAG: hypothetical protein QF441_15260 [Bacteriovoracaceae bacterium]|jgi:hypothetical protein|nr:hypothetical protein [Bacteriovoracaceae bacterium]
MKNVKTLTKFTSIVSIYLTCFILVCFSTQSNIEEDSIYINQVKSFIADFDLDISDQVNPKFNYILTKNLAHPSHHSISQSSSILASIGIFELVTFFLNINQVETYRFALMFLSFFNILIGFLILKSALKNSFEFSAKDVILFILSSPFFYYSFISLSTLEVFLFPFSSLLVFFLLNEKTKLSVFDSFCLGLASSTLFSSKESFLPIVICLSIYLWIKKSYKLSYFILGLLPPFIAKLIHTYFIYGDLVFVNGIIGNIVNDFSLNNISETIIYGFFSLNGLLGAFPLLFILAIFVTIKAFKNSLFKDGFEIFFYLLWILIGLLQTFFLVGPYLEDLFYGRHLMIAMPPIFILYLKFKRSISTKRYLLIMSILILFSMYSTLSFCTQYQLSHYNYIADKYLIQIQPLINQLTQVAHDMLEVLQNNFLSIAIIAFVYLILFKLLIFIKARFNIIIFFQYYQITMAFFLLLLVSVSAYNLSQRDLSYNQEKFKNTIITDNSYFYPFTYVMDFFRAQYIATNRKATRIKINTKRKEYYKKIKNTAIQKNKSFENELENLNFDIDYYYNESLGSKN